MSSEIDQALQRARTHLRNSTLEGLEAARALLEAVVHASGLTTESADSLTSQLQAQLEDLISALRGNASFALPRALTEPLNEALDAEIKRWEELARNDHDARLVLRAFLGMRELLWEYSTRTEGARAPVEPRPKTPPPHKASRSARNRVQRFDVED